MLTFYCTCEGGTIYTCIYSKEFFFFFFDLRKISHHSFVQFLTRGQVYSESNILYLSACVSPDRFGLIRSSGSQVLGWVLLIKCTQTGDDKYCEHEPLKTRQRDDWIKSGIWRTQWGDGEWEMGVMRGGGGAKESERGERWWIRREMAWEKVADEGPFSASHSSAPTFPPPPPSISSHVNGFPAPTADPENKRAPFTQRFPLCIACHDAHHELCRLPPRSASEWDFFFFPGASVNATKSDIVFPRRTYRFAIFFLCVDCTGVQNGKRWQAATSQWNGSVGGAISLSSCMQ